MRKENIRIIGMIVLFVALVVLVVCFDEIKAVVSGMMVEQADSLMDQLLR